jgi:ABC-type glycerol-3-phosphate transport system substrate-binding protein
MIIASGKGLFHCVRLSIVLASLIVSSCSLATSNTATIWTDTPEILLAVELFNASQNRHIVTVHYVDNLPESLMRSATSKSAAPSFVIGKGLRTRHLSDSFQSLDHLFDGRTIQREAFFPELLKAGYEDGRQLLVPVSFNALLILQKKSMFQDLGTSLDVPLPDPSVITMEDIRRRSILFDNILEGKSARMGFSPRWPDKDFLFQWLQLKGADLKENKSKRDKMNAPIPLVWETKSLDSAILDIRAYIEDFNISADTEDSFSFKYLSAPTYKNIENGRILFGAMGSSDYFLLSPVERARIEFKYFGNNDRIALLEDSRFAGIIKKAKGRRSAEQFLTWFFNEGNQRKLLEKSRALRISETAFGIAGGFSSLKQVTGSVFPQFYTDLRGKTPPEKLIAAGQPMPPFWDRIKKEFIIPWLDSIAASQAPIKASDDFLLKLNDYLKRNPSVR